MRERAQHKGNPTENGCALITGASRGIGAATASALAKEGWRVGINYRNNDQAAERIVKGLTEAGLQAISIRGDVRDPATVDEMFSTLEEAYGPVLALVNSAGTRIDKLTAEMTDEEWAEQMDINLKAPMLTCRRAVMGMLRARFGRIVNISSIVGMRANPGQSAYGATKSGLIGFSKCLAAEVAKRNVTVNVVAPGFIDTDLTADVPVEKVVPLIPAQRQGTVDEVAACARFFASPAASYVTGSVLVVDGGLSA